MSSAITEKEVADYLTRHPAFFERYADLLTQVLIPNPHGGHAISITERQVGILRERAKKLEGKLAELVQFGEDNDAIAGKLHRLAVALTGAATLDHVLNALYGHLGEDFAVPHVIVRLWGPEARGERPEFAPPDQDTLSFIERLKHPHCGPAAGLQAFAWLPAGTRSVAVMPLRREERGFGMLALASEESQRFHSDMGTVYLARLADLAAAALGRTLA